MVDRKALLADLQKVVRSLEKDLRARAEEVREVDKDLRADYEAARTAKRTAESFEEWRDEEITQAAVAWVLLSTRTHPDGSRLTLPDGLDVGDAVPLRPLAAPQPVALGAGREGRFPVSRSRTL